MRKIILNKCFGGFGISQKAYEMFLKKKQITRADCLFVDEQYREDKDLIEIIEKLGDEANGKYSNLVIIEIPEDMEYLVYKYNGFEILYDINTKIW